MNNPATTIKVEPPAALRGYPAKLFVETTTRCNLGCLMCIKQTHQGCAMSEGEMSSAAFRTFRGNVLAYDYPVCSSCTLAPCDYVQTDEFQQDCHIGDIPCGACLWCMGLFQCLR